MAEWKERPQYTPVPPAAPARDTGQGAAAAPAEFAAQEETAAQDVAADEEDGLRIFSASDGEDVARDAAPADCAPAPVRAINEDDDGYDPYSDWHDQGPSAPLFERDPWE